MNPRSVVDLEVLARKGMDGFNNHIGGRPL